jgi:hypothetical protein
VNDRLREAIVPEAHTLSKTAIGPKGRTPLEEAMRPPQYTEPTRTELPEPEEGVDREAERGLAHNTPAQEVPRSTGNRDAVKPVGGVSPDTSPLHYRRGRNDKPIDLEDDEYETQDESLIGEEHF